jgi:hypothetical protein
MLQDKRAKEEEGKGGQQAELNRLEKVRGRRDAWLVAAALPQGVAGGSSGASARDSQPTFH